MSLVDMIMIHNWTKCFEKDGDYLENKIFVL